MRLVLGQHAQPVKAGIDQVGQHEIHQPVIAAERHGRLRAVGGQRPQPLTFAASEHNSEHMWLPMHSIT
jgi:hypothetical protein